MLSRVSHAFFTPLGLFPPLEEGIDDGDLLGTGHAVTVGATLGWLEGIDDADFAVFPLLGLFSPLEQFDS